MNRPVVAGAASPSGDFIKFGKPFNLAASETAFAGFESEQVVAFVRSLDGHHCKSTTVTIARGFAG